MDLHDSKTHSGNLIKTWKDNGSKAQIWEADKEGEGFLLETMVSKGGTQNVVDMCKLNNKKNFLPLV